MYGKSYDGVTGLIGVNKQPAGLAAVVSQEPVYDLYRYLYGDGIRRTNAFLTPALYDLIDATPGPITDDPNYNVGGADDTQRPGCLAANYADQAANDDHDSAYWKARNLIPGATGSDVPLFLTQGLTENNTVADGTAQYLQNHTGYERAWLGPGSTCAATRPTRAAASRWAARAGSTRSCASTTSFLKGVTPTVADPPVAVQTNDGKWRAEQSWPPADSAAFTTPLRSGTYTDDGTANATGDGAETGVWTISPPLSHAVHLSGSGQRQGRRHHDAAQRQPRARRLRPRRERHRPADHAPGPPDPQVGDDRPRPVVGGLEVKAGHRIGVKVADANGDWWVHVPTKQTVTVRGGSVSLPFLPAARDTGTIQGDPGTQLAGYLPETVTVPPATHRRSTDAGVRDALDAPRPAPRSPRPPRHALRLGVEVAPARVLPGGGARTRCAARTPPRPARSPLWAATIIASPGTSPRAATLAR